MLLVGDPVDDDVPLGVFSDGRELPQVLALDLSLAFFRLLVGTNVQVDNVDPEIGGSSLLLTTGGGDSSRCGLGHSQAAPTASQG